MQYYKSSLIFTSGKKCENAAEFYSDFTSQLSAFQCILAHCRCDTEQAELLTTTTLSPNHTSQCLQTTLKLRYQPGHEQQILLQSQSSFLITTAYCELQQYSCWDCPKKPYKALDSSVPLQQSVDDRESIAKQPQTSQSGFNAASGI